METKQGSFALPYKLAIVGGGPAGLSILVKAFRLGYHQELLTTNQAAGVCGVALIDQGQPSSLGSGSLVEYQIRSNTQARKFVTNVVSDQTGILAPEKASGTALEALVQSATAQRLERIGANIAPLTLIGQFLGEVGQIIRKEIEKYLPDSQVYSRTKVVCLEQVANGWRLCLLKEGEGSSHCSAIYAQKVVLATGGKQTVPNLARPTLQQKAIPSDFALRREGLAFIKRAILESIEEKMSQQEDSLSTTEERVGRGSIVIVGGSHSAFSVAWACLNKLNDSGIGSRVSSPIKPSPRKSSSPRISSFPEINEAADPDISISDQEIPQYYYDYAGCSAESSVTKVAGLNFDSGAIVVIHRSPVRVFYATQKEAEADGMSDFKYQNYVDQWGAVNPFNGLRGDAKELFLDVKKGREHRVRLHQTHSSGNKGGRAMVDLFYERAKVIVWACGYKANVIPVRDIVGKEIQLKKTNGQVDVNDEAQILCKLGKAERPVGNLFGTGLGYGAKEFKVIPALQSNSSSSPAHRPVLNLTVKSNKHPGKNGTAGEAKGSPLAHSIQRRGEPVARKDGVGFYLKWSAGAILKQVLGKEILGRGIESIKEMEDVVYQQKIRLKASNILVSPNEQKKLVERLCQPHILDLSQSRRHSSEQQTNSPRTTLLQMSSATVFPIMAPCSSPYFSAPPSMVSGKELPSPFFPIQDGNSFPSPISKRLPNVRRANTTDSGTRCAQSSPITAATRLKPFRTGATNVNKNRVESAVASPLCVQGHAGRPSKLDKACQNQSPSHRKAKQSQRIENLLKHGRNVSTDQFPNSHTGPHFRGGQAPLTFLKGHVRSKEANRPQVLRREHSTRIDLLSL